MKCPFTEVYQHLWRVEIRKAGSLFTWDRPCARNVHCRNTAHRQDNQLVNRVATVNDITYPIPLMIQRMGGETFRE